MLAFEVMILSFINDQPSSYSYKYAYISQLKRHFAPESHLMLVLKHLTDRGILFEQPHRNACCPGYWKITKEGELFLEQHKEHLSNI